MRACATMLLKTEEAQREENSILCSRARDLNVVVKPSEEISILSSRARDLNVVVKPSAPFY